MGDIKTIVAQNIKKYRDMKNVKQKVLASKLGINSSTLCMWESGENSIDIEMVYKISKILDVPLNDLFGDPYFERQYLTMKESDLLRKYRSLNDAGKDRVDNTLDYEYKTASGEDDKEDESKKGA